MASSRAADEGTLLKAILQESATEVMVFDADTLRIIQANPAAAKNLQYQPRALQNLTPLDFLPPEDRQAIHTLLTLLSHGKPRRTALSVLCRLRYLTLYPFEVLLLGAGGRGGPGGGGGAGGGGRRGAARQA